MEIKYEVKKLPKHVIKMAKLRSNCSCWGFGFKSR